MNYSTLETNVLGSLNECGQVAFLWARERVENDPMAYKAETFAREVDRLNVTLSCLLGGMHNSGRYEGSSVEKLHVLKNYILDRHASYAFSGEKRSWTRRDDLLVAA